MKKLYFLLFCSLFTGLTLAQVSNTQNPRSWNLSMKSQPQAIYLPSVDVNELKKEDRESAQSSFAKPQRIGTEILVEMDLFNSGTWTTLNNGDRIWRLHVIAEGATFSRAIFDLFSLPEGAELYLYNNDRTDKIGPYTASENQEDGILGTWMVQGDDLWLEYYEPKSKRGLGRLSIDSFTYGYVDLYNKENSLAKINQSGACNVDVLCNPNLFTTGTKDWSTTRDDNINSVAAIVFPMGGQTFVCTGAMMNNAAADATPYFLTANHCLGQVSDGLGSSFNASGWSFGFQWYASANDRSCASFTNTGTSSPIAVNVLSGAQLVANNNDSDFALFLLNQTPPPAWNLYYAGWDRTGFLPTEQFGLHHPAGDIMKLCRNDQAPIKETLRFSFNGSNTLQVWNIADWDYGVTEGGSSGSILLDQNDRVIGQLAGGFAACSGTSDNNAEDWYGRFDTSWNSGFTAAQRLRDWLDPNNTGLNTLDGDYYVNLSTDDIDESVFDFSLYPNPAKDQLNVDIDLPATYVIFDLSGARISAGALTGSNNQIFVRDLKSGLYFFTVDAGKHKVVKKFLKL